MSRLSGLLRSFMFSCFVSLMIGSLWAFAQTATPPSIPAWRGGSSEFKPAPAQRTQYQANVQIGGESEYEDLILDHSTAAAFDDDNEFSRRST